MPTVVKLVRGRYVLDPPGPKPNQFQNKQDADDEAKRRNSLDRGPPPLEEPPGGAPPPPAPKVG